MMRYDVFICHASADKDALVRPLAALLKDARLEVWYDEFELRVGDSLRRAIDLGLSQSRFGIVILSPWFFQRNWPQWELDGLLQRDLSQSVPLLLPVWHEIQHADVLAHSPSLADKVAVSSEQGVQHVAAELLKVLQPEGSTLQIARTILRDNGVEAPAVTDDWWLDVVDYAGGRVTYESWEFPLVSGDSPAERGAYIAKAAMQWAWTGAAAEEGICQMTEPQTVHAFIDRMPGLFDACVEYPYFLSTYAPQLTLPGYGGPFEDTFREWAEDVLTKNSSRRHAGPAYDSEMNFRVYPARENQPGHLACQWVQGELFGPHIRSLEPFEYICWLLSERSAWLPDIYRTLLLTGLREWPVWNWEGGPDLYGERWDNAGSLSADLHNATETSSALVSPRGADDLLRRVHLAIDKAGLPEAASVLRDRFLSQRFLESWISSRRARIDRHTEGDQQ